MTEPGGDSPAPKGRRANGRPRSPCRLGCARRHEEHRRAVRRRDRAAWFLAEFVGDTPWIHLDIAGPAWAEKVSDLGPKGGTGVPVRTLVRYVLDSERLTAVSEVPVGPTPRTGPVLGIYAHPDDAEDLRRRHDGEVGRRGP